MTTPRPWHIGNFEGDVQYIYANTPKFEPIAKELKPADAALIVTAVNAHDDLVKALEGFVSKGGGMTLTDEMIEAAAKAAHEAQFPYPWVGGDGEYETDTRHEMRAALTAVFPLLQQDWQPIETAPKDKRILIFIQRQYYSSVEIATWNEDKYAKKPRPYWEWSKHISSDRAQQPSHWLPLPEPPKTKE